MSLRFWSNDNAPGTTRWYRLRNCALGRGPYGDGYGWWDRIRSRFDRDFPAEEENPT